MDLMSTIDKYSEVSGDEFTAKIREFVAMVGVVSNRLKSICLCFRIESIEIFIREA